MINLDLSYEKLGIELLEIEKGWLWNILGNILYIDQKLSHICFFEDQGIKLDPTTIWRIGKRMHVRYRPPEKRKPKRERTLYSLSSPWELQVDVSFPYWRSKMICWYNAIDDCTRWVYGEIVEEYGVLESIAFIRSLLDKVPFNVHTVRTDNGKEFWKQFTEYLTSIGITHIKNEPYMPQHNWKIERYHWTRKRLEVIFWTREMELEELRYRNNQWLFFYNYHRRHTWLAMQGLTPLKKLITSLWYNQCVNLSMQQYIFHKVMAFLYKGVLSQEKQDDFSLYYFVLFIYFSSVFLFYKFIANVGDSFVNYYVYDFSNYSWIGAFFSSKKIWSTGKGIWNRTSSQGSQTMDR